MKKPAPHQPRPHHDEAPRRLEEKKIRILQKHGDQWAPERRIMEPAAPEEIIPEKESALPLYSGSMSKNRLQAPPNVVGDRDPHATARGDHGHKSLKHSIPPLTGGTGAATGGKVPGGAKNGFPGKINLASPLPSSPDGPVENHNVVKRSMNIEEKRSISWADMSEDPDDDWDVDLHRQPWEHRDSPRPSKTHSRGRGRGEKHRNLGEKKSAGGGPAPPREVVERTFVSGAISTAVGQQRPPLEQQPAPQWTTAGAAVPLYAMGGGMRTTTPNGGASSLPAGMPQAVMMYPVVSASKGGHFQHIGAPLQFHHAHVSGGNAPTPGTTGLHQQPPRAPVVGGGFSQNGTAAPVGEPAAQISQPAPRNEPGAGAVVLMVPPSAAPVEQQRRAAQQAPAAPAPVEQHNKLPPEKAHHQKRTGGSNDAQGSGCSVASRSMSSSSGGAAGGAGGLQQQQAEKTKEAGPRPQTSNSLAPPPITTQPAVVAPAAPPQERKKPGIVVPGDQPPTKPNTVLMPMLQPDGEIVWMEFDASKLQGKNFRIENGVMKPPTPTAPKATSREEQEPPRQEQEPQEQQVVVPATPSNNAPPYALPSVPALQSSRASVPPQTSVEVPLLNRNDGALPCLRMEPPDVEDQQGPSPEQQQQMELLSVSEQGGQHVDTITTGDTGASNQSNRGSVVEPQSPGLRPKAEAELTISSSEAPGAPAPGGEHEQGPLADHFLPEGKPPDHVPGGTGPFHQAFVAESNDDYVVVPPASPGPYKVVDDDHKFGGRPRRQHLQSGGPRRRSRSCSSRSNRSEDGGEAAGPGEEEWARYRTMSLDTSVFSRMLPDGAGGPHAQQGGHPQQPNSTAGASFGASRPALRRQSWSGATGSGVVGPYEVGGQQEHQLSGGQPAQDPTWLDHREEHDADPLYSPQEGPPSTKRRSFRGDEDLHSNGNVSVCEDDPALLSGASADGLGRSSSAGNLLGGNSSTEAVLGRDPLNKFLKTSKSWDDMSSDYVNRGRRRRSADHARPADDQGGFPLSDGGEEEHKHPPLPVGLSHDSLGEKSDIYSIVQNFSASCVSEGASSEEEGLSSPGGLWKGPRGKMIPVGGEENRKDSRRAGEKISPRNNSRVRGGTTASRTGQNFSQEQDHDQISYYSCGGVTGQSTHDVPAPRTNLGQQVLKSGAKMHKSRSRSRSGSSQHRNTGAEPGQHQAAKNRSPGAKGLRGNKRGRGGGEVGGAIHGTTSSVRSRSYNDGAILRQQFLSPGRDERVRPHRHSDDPYFFGPLLHAGHPSTSSFGIHESMKLSRENSGNRKGSSAKGTLHDSSRSQSRSPLHDSAVRKASRQVFPRHHVVSLFSLVVVKKSHLSIWVEAM